MIVIGVLLVLVFIVGSILGIVSSLRIRTLKNDIAALRGTIDRIELQRLNSDLLSKERTPDPASPDLTSIDPIRESPIEPNAIATSDEDKETIEPENTLPEPEMAAASIAEEATTSQSIKPDLEQSMGGKWAVWVGGITLALGAVFLAKFSIDQGLLDPKTRLILAGLFSLCLLALGEWTRRRGSFFSVPGYDKANIPATLTAAGTIGLFASSYLAYAVFGFIGPALAFIVMGAVSVATMVAALLHGPALAALGLLGAYAAPFMVSTSAPVPWTLALYILFVSASALAVARWRMWQWLAIVAGIGLVLFAAVLATISHSLSRITLDFYLLTAFAMVAYAFVISIYLGTEEWSRKSDKAATALLVSLMLSALYLVSYEPVAMLGFIEMTAALIIGLGLVWYFPQVRYLALATIFVVAVRYLSFDVPFSQTGGIVEGLGTDGPGNVVFLLAVKNANTFLAAGLILALYAIFMGHRGASHSLSKTLLAISGTVLPILLLIIAWLKVASFARSWVFFFVALVLVAAFAWTARSLIANEDDEQDDEEQWPATIFVTGAFATLALAVTIILEQGFLTIALALIVSAIAYVHVLRPMPGLKQLALALMALWAMRVAWNPGIVYGELGTTPIFNWLLYGWGLSTLAFASACWQFAKAERNLWTDIIEGITIAAATITIALLATHAWDPDELFTFTDTLGEAALLVLTGGGVALGLLWARRNSGRTVNLAIDILGYGGMGIALIFVLLVFNPMVTGEEISDNYLLNALSLGYLAPAIVYGSITWVAHKARPGTYFLAASATGGLLAFTWVSLVVRNLFHSGRLDVGATSNAELYTYSVIWLAIGIALLAAGLIFNSQLVRKISAGLIVLVILKAFLIDMANLEGIWRALSFIGLGGVLVGVGLVYQHLLASAPSSANTESSVRNDE